MSEIILDSFLDSLKMLPFLFFTYLFLEYLEHRGSSKFAEMLKHSGRLGPLGGSLLGCVPQCGFSVAAANLYSGGIITAGTLVAVFISTSDEAIPILLANPGSFALVVKVILYKVVLAIFAGFLLDFLLKRRPALNIVNDNHLHVDCRNVVGGKQIVFSAIKHTLYVFIFVLAVLMLINLVIYYIGEDRLSALLMTESILQPIIAGLIGLIPNCAPSVILTQLYISGGISFGSLFAGLSTAAGMGMVLLFKNNHNIKQNLLLVLYMFIIGVGAGMFL